MTESGLVFGFETCGCRKELPGLRGEVSGGMGIQQIPERSWPTEKAVLFAIISVLTSSKAVCPLAPEHKT